MNAPDPIKTASKMAPMTSFAVGRIDHVEKYQNVFNTRIKTPAPDAYEYPSTITLRSKQRLGAVGDEIGAEFRIGGIPRTYNRTDKDTGEVTKVHTSDHFFNVIE